MPDRDFLIVTMNRERLIPCPSCACHFRRPSVAVDVVTCPHCDAEIATRGPNKTAAAILMGLTALSPLTLTACGDDTGGTSTTGAGGAADGGGGIAVGGAYGGGPTVGGGGMADGGGGLADGGGGMADGGGGISVGGAYGGGPTVGGGGGGN